MINPLLYADDGVNLVLADYGRRLGHPKPSSITNSAGSTANIYRLIDEFHFDEFLMVLKN